MSEIELNFSEYYKALYNKKTPSPKEIVMVTVTEIHPHGIYVNIEEYGIRAYCPINEISTRWIKRPSDVVKINQKLVAQVYKISHGGRVVNVSIRRVLPGERKKKMIEWKRLRRSFMIFNIIAEKLKVDIKEVMKKLAKPLSEEFDNPYYGLEEIVKNGKDVLKDLGVPEEWIDPVYEIVKSYVKPSEVELKKILLIRTLAPDGINRIKKAFEDALKGREKNVLVEYLSAPRYLIKIRDYEWKEAEKTFKEIIKTLEKNILDKKWRSEILVEGEEGKRKRR